MADPVAIELEFFPGLEARRPVVPVGQTLRLHIGFRGEDGDLVEASGKLLTLRRPDGAAVELPAEAWVLDADGRYHVDTVPDEPGSWAARAECTGPAPAVAERRFVAQSSLVVPPDDSAILVTDDLAPIVTEPGEVLRATRLAKAPLPAAGPLAAPVLLGDWLKDQLRLDSFRRTRAGRVDTTEWGVLWQDMRDGLATKLAADAMFRAPPVELPAGDVNTLTPFVVDQSLLIRGAGMQLIEGMQPWNKGPPAARGGTKIILPTRTLAGGGQPPAYPAFDIRDTAVGTVIQDMTLDGNGRQFTTPTIFGPDVAAGSLIYVHAANVVVQDVILTDAWNNGVWVSRSAYDPETGNGNYYPGEPRWFKATRVHGYKNSLANPGGSCINIGSGTNAQCFQCSDEGSPVAYQSDISSGATARWVGCESLAPTYAGLDGSGNRVGGVGFFLAGTNNVLEGCVVQFAPWIGIWVDGDPTGLGGGGEGARVTDCEMSNCGIGLYIKAESEVIVTNPRIRNAGILTSAMPAGTADAIVLDNSAYPQHTISIINPIINYSTPSPAYRRPIFAVGPVNMPIEDVIPRSAAVVVLAMDGAIQDGIEGGVPAGLAVGSMLGATPPPSDNSGRLATTAFAKPRTATDAEIQVLPGTTALTGGANQVLGEFRVVPSGSTVSFPTWSWRADDGSGPLAITGTFTVDRWTGSAWVLAVASASAAAASSGAFAGTSISPAAGDRFRVRLTAGTIPAGAFVAIACNTR